MSITENEKIMQLLNKDASRFIVYTYDTQIPYITDESNVNYYTLSSVKPIKELLTEKRLLAVSYHIKPTKQRTTIYVPFSLKLAIEDRAKDFVTAFDSWHQALYYVAHDLFKLSINDISNLFNIDRSSVYNIYKKAKSNL